VLAHASVLHSDDYEQQLQEAVQKGEESSLVAPPGDLVVAYVKVTDSPPCPAIDVPLRVNEALAGIQVPEYLRPVTDQEVQVAPGSPEVGNHSVAVGQRDTADTRPMQVNVAAGKFRTRSICYTGWGAPGYPLITSAAYPDFARYVQARPELRNLVYAASGNTDVLIVPKLRTMAINDQFDPLFQDAEGKIGGSRKFDPTDPTRPFVFGGYTDGSGSSVWPAEEWVLRNASIPLWGDTTPANQPEGHFQEHFLSYPVTRAEGQARSAQDPNFRIVNKGVDHPFHIHVNPFYVFRIEVPDASGKLHDILDQPRWQDVVAIPRGGRVVFRSRFPDYLGKFVHHCHILQHEDNGMMHVVETTPTASEANYVPRDRVASAGMSSEEVDAIYPFPGGATTPADRLKELYRQSIGFIDPNNTGQVYPGFDVQPPVLGGGTTGRKASLVLDGTSAYVIRNPYPVFPARQLTVELWAKADPSKTWGTLFSYTTRSMRNALNLYYEGRILYLYLNNAYRDTGITFDDGDWHHYAVTWDSSTGTYTMYRDAQPYPGGNVGAGAAIENGGGLVFGRSQRTPGSFFSGNYAFHGLLAEVRIWSSVLSGQQIRARMRQRLQGTEAGLVGYWPLNDGQGTTAVDKSPNGNDGTLEGATWSTAVPFGS
ncbi:MAG: multicopper oxidase domain-containing protein, partial [Holophagales bacterium]|nr:multicopper oxidase domain-containing protein [Holophagales bacterium]